MIGNHSWINLEGAKSFRFPDHRLDYIYIYNNWPISVVNLFALLEIVFLSSTETIDDRIALGQTTTKMTALFTIENTTDWYA